MTPGLPMRRSSLALLPPLAWLLVFFAVPMLVILAYSFATRSEGGAVVLGFSLENYARLADSKLYFWATLRSLRIAIVVTVVTLFVAYPVAYYIALVATRRRVVLFVLLIVPWWCSILVKNFAWVAILADTGVLNRILAGAGLIDAPVRILYTEISVVIGLVHVLIPFMVMPIYATLEKLDTRLVEAAANLGSSPFRSFLEVVLPLSLPGVAAGCLLTFILAFGSFITPALLGSERTLMIANLIQGQFMEAFDWPFGSAISMVLLGVVLVILAAFNRLVGLDRLWGSAR
ncbi:MAG TPA: ABC transporter permease [Stellaceae bacterium]|nr:ABC transporter permease [Stellaceae bacterium]